MGPEPPKPVEKSALSGAIEWALSPEVLGLVQWVEVVVSLLGAAMTFWLLRTVRRRVLFQAALPGYVEKLQTRHQRLTRIVQGREGSAGQELQSLGALLTDMCKKLPASDARQRAEKLNAYLDRLDSASSQVPEQVLGQVAGLQEAMTHLIVEHQWRTTQ